MEYAPGGDLFDYVYQATQYSSFGLPEANARWIFQQLVLTVRYCHTQVNITLGDIKLENVLLESNPIPIIKLCDFGYSGPTGLKQAPDGLVGTPQYMAPELLATHPRLIDPAAADVWACGVALYVMLTGTYPFGDV